MRVWTRPFHSIDVLEIVINCLQLNFLQETQCFQLFPSIPKISSPNKQQFAKTTPKDQSPGSQPNKKMGLSPSASSQETGIVPVTTEHPNLIILVENIFQSINELIRSISAAIGYLNDFYRINFMANGSVGVKVQVVTLNTTGLIILCQKAAIEIGVQLGKYAINKIVAFIIEHQLNRLVQIVKNLF